MPTIKVQFHEMPPRLIPYGSDVALPATFSFTVEGYRYALSADVATEGDGPRVTSLTVAQVEGGDPVSTQGLRIPVARLLRQAVELAAWTPLRDREGQAVPWDMGAAGPASATEVQRAGKEVEGTRRHWRMTDEHLADVARVYLANPRNTAGRRAPVPAVQKHFGGVSRATANRWIAAARLRHPDLFEEAEKRRSDVLAPRKARKR